MNRKLQGMLGRLLNDQIPVIRKSGWGSKAVITIYQRGKVLRFVPVGCGDRIKVDTRDQKSVLLVGADVLCEFDRREDADEALAKMHSLVAPGLLRWVLRFICLWIFYMAFFSSSAPPSAAQVPAGYPDQVAAARYAPVSVPPAAPALQGAVEDPFGLPLTAEAKH